MQQDGEDGSVEHHLTMCRMESPKENVISLVMVCPFKDPLRLSEWCEVLQVPDNISLCVILLGLKPACASPYKIIDLSFFFFLNSKMKKTPQHSKL